MGSTVVVPLSADRSAGRRIHPRRSKVRASQAVVRSLTTEQLRRMGIQTGFGSGLSGPIDLRPGSAEGGERR